MNVYWIGYVAKTIAESMNVTGPMRYYRKTDVPRHPQSSVAMMVGQCQILQSFIGNGNVST